MHPFCRVAFQTNRSVDTAIGELNPQINRHSTPGACTQQRGDRAEFRRTTPKLGSRSWLEKYAGN